MDRTPDKAGSPSRDCPSDLMLDRYLLGEFERAEEAMLAAHIDGCDRCGAFVREAATFDGGEAEERILATIERESRREEAAQPARSRAPAIFIGGLAVAVVIAIALSPLWRRPPQETGESSEKAALTVRLKGAIVTLLLYRLDDGEPVLLSPGEPLEPGDVLQASVSAATVGHVALYDLMEDEVELLAPVEGRPAMALLPGRESPLEPAFKVETTAGSERLVLLFCPRPFSSEAAPATPGPFSAWAPQNDCVRIERPFVPAKVKPTP